ncbi:MAG: NTP transferase domain-containing protein [Bacteroidetes bacterium]|nr:NTP transferase domain-containing protein [Bacteroidota bacterium]
MQNINHAVIIAAGRGQRMMPLTKKLPKAMANYDGSTLIANGIEKLKLHIPNVHITVGYQKALLAKHVIEHNVSSIFNTEGKGNCWWIYNTLLKFINEPVIVLTCDNVVELDIDLLTKNYFHHGEPACMVIPVKPVEGLDGDYIFHNKNVVHELSRLKTSDIYCSGIQIINPAKINSSISPVEDFNLLWKYLIEQKQLYCSDIYPSKWFTVDTVEQLNTLQSNSSYSAPM